MSAAWPQLNVFTDSHLTNLLVTNPTAQTFPMSINGSMLGVNPAFGVFADVTRQQILNELSNRIAAHKQNGKTYDNAFYDFSTTTGSYPLGAIVAGQPNVVSPATPGVGGANPTQELSQIK